MNETVRIIKNGKDVMSLGDSYILGYDNYIWWQLGLVIDILKTTEDIEIIKKNIKTTTQFEIINTTGNEELIIDLDDDQIDMPYFPLFNKEEIKDNFDFEINSKEDKYFVKYSQEEIYEIPLVYFNNINILKTKKVSLKDFKTIVDFVNNTHPDEYDVLILNDKFVIKYNII
jgi:hypothetical protein